jgi:hypothetical protein
VPEEECSVLTGQDGAAAAQAPDGQLSGCFRVGPVRPGPYTLQLEPSFYGDHEALSPGGGIELSPDKGPPGTTVEISGFSPDARTGGQTPNESALVCWDGCESGFSHWQPVRWSPDGHFTTGFEVPAIPWLEIGGPHPLRSAEYRITLQCVPTCGSKPVEAVFRLQTGEPEACVESRPCARFEISPDSAGPGEIVRIRGWAPLLPPPSNHYKLHVKEGHADKDAGLASAPFSARAGRRWAELPPVKPTLQVPGRPGLAARPGDTRLLAHCVPDGIRISRDRGVHWRVVDTRTATKATQGTGYRMDPSVQVWCGAPVPDPRHPGSAFALFTVAREDTAPPPFYSVGLFTLDGGRTWRPVPVPPGTSTESFNGFALSGGAVLARFRDRQEGSEWRGNAPALDWEPGMKILATSDGGRHWRPGRDTCPSHGPCVTWGPTAEYSCAKGREFRLVRTSGDGGRKWSSPRWPGWIATCDAASLVSLSNGDMLLVAADGLAEPFPLQLSKDAGVTWEPIELPQLPDAEATIWPEFPNLTMLGDGRVLGFAYPSGPQLLDPGADRWCPVRGEPLGLDAQAHRYEAMSGRLWWIDDRTHAVRSQPEAGLHCR